MKKHTIFLFMWGYQSHYRTALEHRAKDTFKELGVYVEPKVLLVGARIPGRENLNSVCVEPEDGEWPLATFTGLLELIEATVSNHPLQHVFYGDEPSMREKPENIRRDSVTTAVKQMLLPYDTKHSVRSFCGRAHPVGDYYVVPVVQVPEFVFEQFPPLREPIGDDRFSGHPSFIHASMATLLAEATEELRRADPGRSLNSKMRRAGEIVRNAAVAFMRTPGIAIKDRYSYVDLFERFNVISSLMYEGAHGMGRLLLVSPENEAIDYMLRLKEPVPFEEPRWARKILQMAATDIALVADCGKIYGLGRLKSSHDSAAQDAFTIEFLDHYHWELRCGVQVLLRSHYGEPKLPQEPISREQFISNCARLFPESTSVDHDCLWLLFNAAIRLSHGSMIVVAADASEEARRLAQQGTGIEPTMMTEELLGRVSGIDGTIILDPQGICHAVGVILDGPATAECTPSRGSRFNSGLRYVSASDVPRLAIVLSDDHTVDIIPMLRPQVERGEIERNILVLEKATLDDYYKPRNWLDKHRFYLNDDQCERVNSALDRIEKLPRDVGEIVILTSRFEPDPDMDDSYFTKSI